MKCELPRAARAASEVSGAVSGPIAADLFVRAAGNHMSFDGPIENEFLTRMTNAARANA